MHWIGELRGSVSAVSRAVSELREEIRKPPVGSTAPALLRELIGEIPDKGDLKEGMAIRPMEHRSAPSVEGGLCRQAKAVEKDSVDWKRGLMIYEGYCHNMKRG